MRIDLYKLFFGMKCFADDDLVFRMKWIADVKRVVLCCVFEYLLSNASTYRSLQPKSLESLLV